MANTIKFNLICDEKPIRTIEDLRNNFCIEDVLEYYYNRTLHRWLEARGYYSELSVVDSITSKDSIEILKELISIFDISMEENQIEESVCILKYLNERKKKSFIDIPENYTIKNIIEDYENGYTRLINGIIENPNNITIVKENIEQIVLNYAWILKLDHRNLFYVLQRKSALLAIMCLLMNEKSRNYYLPVEITEDDGTITLDIEKKEDKKIMYEIICQMITQYSFIKSLGENLRSYGDKTNGHWKNLEPQGKKYMIISNLVICQGIISNKNI